MRNTTGLLIHGNYLSLELICESLAHNFFDSICMIEYASRNFRNIRSEDAFDSKIRYLEAYLMGRSYDFEQKSIISNLSW